jgi:4-amino-4-deoxyprephenate dehydrogenase
MIAPDRSAYPAQGNKPNVLILGVAGGFGKLLTSLLALAGHRLGGIDTVPPHQDTAKLLSFFIRDDVASPSPATLKALEDVDWVLSCLPQDPTFAALRSVTPHLRKGSLFMDILSVKTPISGLLRSGNPDVEYLSIHPMFAPSVGFSGQNVVIVKNGDGRHRASIEELLGKWGARVHYLTAEQHDRSTAAVQVATHAAILSFGLALKAMGYSIEEALPISSPPHRTLLALLARIANGNPEVYWQIQTENPLASFARTSIITAITDLQKSVEAGSLMDFSESLSGVREMLGDANDQLSELAVRLFALPVSIAK